MSLIRKICFIEPTNTGCQAERAPENVEPVENMLRTLLKSDKPKNVP